MRPIAGISFVNIEYFSTRPGIQDAERSPLRRFRSVKNLGSSDEPSSLLQSVQVFQDATRVDQKGAPPLRAGGAATVHYRLQRSSEARPGTTHLRFQLVLRNPHGVPITNCSTSNDTYRINV